MAHHANVHLLVGSSFEHDYLAAATLLRAMRAKAAVSDKFRGLFV